MKQKQIKDCKRIDQFENHLMEVYVHALNILRSISFETVRLKQPFDGCNSKLN